MSERKIRLNGAKDVSRFVQAAERCDFDVDLCLNRIVVDAKSLMGVLMMDLSQDLTVRYNHDLDEGFESVLSEYAV